MSTREGVPEAGRPDSTHNCWFCGGTASGAIVVQLRSGLGEMEEERRTVLVPACGPCQSAPRSSSGRADTLVPLATLTSTVAWGALVYFIVRGPWAGTLDQSLAHAPLGSLVVWAALALILLVMDLFALGVAAWVAQRAGWVPAEVRLAQHPEIAPALASGWYVA